MNRERRLILESQSYTIDEEERDEIQLAQVAPRAEPPEGDEVLGEPWGWTKPGPRPRGWPGPGQSMDDPGPYDGEWEPRREDW